MKYIFISIVSFTLCGCTITPPSDYPNWDSEYCILTAEQQQVVIANIKKVIAKVSNKSITYDLPRTVVDHGWLYKSKDRCYAYLAPESVQPGSGVLDGDGGVYINIKTLKPEGVFWFLY